MGYGTLLYRRSSGIYVFRLSVPEACRSWFSRSEIHHSTHQRERAVATLVGLQFRVGWLAIMGELRAMDLKAIESGSPLIVGDGVIEIGHVASVIKTDVAALALALANRGTKFFAFADGWPAVQYNGPHDCMWHEDGEIPFVEIDNVGTPCHLRGLVEITNAVELAMRLKHGHCEIKPYQVWHPDLGTCFVAQPTSLRIDPKMIFVQKTEVSAWRESIMTAMSRPTSVSPSRPVLVHSPGSKILDSFRPNPPEIDGNLSAAKSGHELTPMPVDLPAVAPRLEPTSVLTSEPVGRFASMRMSTVAEKFIVAMSTAKAGGVPRWKSDEADRNRSKLAVFCALTDDPTMGELQTVPESESLIEQFMDTATGLPTGPNLTKARASTDGSAPALIAWADANGVTERMSLRTVKNSYLAKASECLNWAQKKGYITANPCAIVLEQTQLDPALFAKLRRVPLSPGELQQVFGCAWFLTGKPRPTSNGKLDKNFRPFHYWLPLLGLYTGGRINELSQLYLDDFKVTDTGQHYIAFTLDRPDKKAESSEDDDDEDLDRDDDLPSADKPVQDKSLKTANSRRDVPLHSELQRLGLIRYVEALRLAGQERLFPELRFDSKKGYGADSRKWFNDRLLGQKLKIPRDGTRVFHSLRHNFVVAARHAGLVLRERQQLIGHKRGGDTTTEEVYDHDDELARLLPKLVKVTYPIPVIAAFDVESGLSALRYKAALTRSRARAKIAK
ncbi:MAG: site-specific integrase [Leptothrix sp. (in: b-proteobacteria)]